LGRRPVIQPFLILTGLQETAEHILGRLVRPFFFKVGFRTIGGLQSINKSHVVFLFCQNYKPGNVGRAGFGQVINDLLDSAPVTLEVVHVKSRLRRGGY